jgi:hypothetical protein
MDRAEFLSVLSLQIEEIKEAIRALERLDTVTENTLGFGPHWTTSEETTPPQADLVMECVGCQNIHEV